MVRQLKLPLGEVLPLAPPPLSHSWQQHLFNLYRQHEVARSPLVRDERAGFSASWVETVIARALERGSATVFDPFAGAGTTLLAAEKMGVECLGVEAHPFVARIASAKLLCRTDPELYLKHIRKVKIRAENLSGCVDNYPALIRSCLSDRSLEGLNRSL